MADDTVEPLESVDGEQVITDPNAPQAPSIKDPGVISRMLGRQAEGGATPPAESTAQVDGPVDWSKCLNDGTELENDVCPQCGYDKNRRAF